MLNSQIDNIAKQRILITKDKIIIKNNYASMIDNNVHHPRKKNFPNVA